MIKCIPPELLAKLKEDALKGKITAAQLVNMLPEERAALKSILEDYVAEKLGIKVKNEEVKQINERAARIEAAQQKVGSDIGNPDKLAENLEFFKAKKEMDDYLQGLSPAHKLKVATGTIGRGMMLASLKSPILNIGSNLEIGVMEALSRRLSDANLKFTDNKLAIDYVKFVNKIYQETGYDISRMMNISDGGVGGARVLGDTVHSQGPGVVRRVGRFVEDIVFKQLMGAPDVAFSAAHFADSVNLKALELAKGVKSDAQNIMRDAMRLEPQTPEGLILRGQGILDAQVATWTNRTWASRVSMNIQKTLNDVSGDLRIGDYLLPFIKTPANIIATGMDYAGMGIPKALVKTYQAFKTGDLKSPEYVRGMTRDLARAGLGLVGALLITSQLKDDDFVGAYDPNRAQIEQLRNSNYNAIRVGGKWISTDWLGPLMVPVTAMMYSRRYGKTWGEKKFLYAKGVLASAANIPGVSDIADAVRGIAYQKNQNLETLTGATADYITTTVYSRLVPSVLSDVARAIDPNVRQGGKGMGGVMSKIPFVSQTLPKKLDIFGNEIRSEGALSTLLFGSRVKTDKETEVVKEISRVSTVTDKGVAFTDWNKSSSKVLDQFKQRVGEKKFEDAKAKYGKELLRELTATLKNPIYKKLSDEDKLKVINGKDTDAMEMVFRQYGFKYRTLPTVRLPKNL